MPKATTTPTPVIDEVEVMTPKALAAKIGVTPKALRRVLRSMTDDRAGKGGNWKLTQGVCDAIEAKFAEGVRRSTTLTADAIKAPTAD